MYTGLYQRSTSDKKLQSHPTIRSCNPILVPIQSGCQPRAYKTNAGIIRPYNINKICGLVHLRSDMVASKYNNSKDNNDGKIGHKWTDNEHSTTYHTHTNHGITQWYQIYCFLVLLFLIWHITVGYILDCITLVRLHLEQKVTFLLTLTR